MREKKEREGVDHYFKAGLNYIPTNLNLDELFLEYKPIGFHSFNKDYSAKLLSSLYTIPHFNKEIRERVNKNDGFVPLYSKELEKSNREYKKYLELLISAKVLEANNAYSTSTHRSKSYRFTTTYSDQPFKRYYNYGFGNDVPVTSNGSFFEEKCYASTGTAKKLLQNLTLLKLSDQAKETLDKDFEQEKISIGQYNSTGIAIDMLSEGRLFGKQDSYGRIHTNLTCLKKQYRNFLSTTEGEQLVSIDIKNSQPFFSLALLNPHFWEKDNVSKMLSIHEIENDISLTLQQPELKQPLIMFCESVEDKGDVKLYKELVLDGSLYEFLQQELRNAGINCSDRKQAKQILFQTYFSKEFHLWKSKPASVFRKIFPSISHLFALVKKPGHHFLACLLQSIESHVLIENIISDFWKVNPQIPIFTIHDSIVVPIKKHISMKWDMLHGIEQRIGYKPALLPELWRA